MFASLDSNDNNNDSLTLNNNTITLTSLKSKYNLPDNLSLTTISRYVITQFNVLNSFVMTKQSSLSQELNL